MSHSVSGCSEGGPGSGTLDHIYHERQVKELCALHALNNLFQLRDNAAFTKAQLDAICLQLSPDVWINPHRSLLGLGNYDVNVIMAALQTRGHEAVWWDKRRDPATLNLSNISGFILNIPSEYRLGFLLLPLRRRHWVAVRQIRDNYYNLDSKLERPHLIGKVTELVQFLKEQLSCRDKELFLVVPGEVEREQTWLLPGAPPPAATLGDRDANCVTLADLELQQP